MKVLKSIHGESLPIKPIWMMRQAGRYLPEYRSLRNNFNNFMEFCRTPKAVVEATLQPIKRFDLDAAIIFSDILVIPHFLGQKVDFVKDHGPILEKIDDLNTILDNNIDSNIETIYESLNSTRKLLSADKVLIGFAGCPWTIATYMMGYHKSKGFDAVLKKAMNTPNFADTLSKLSRHIAAHCINQIKTGANVIQLFESWAVTVPDDLQKEWLFNQARLIINTIRESLPNTPIIYFAKNCVQQAINELSDLNITFGVDHNTQLSNININQNICLQGNLSPEKLAAGNFEEDLINILNFAKDRPFIVNLGHGILPQTPVENVERFISITRDHCK